MQRSRTKMMLQPCRYLEKPFIMQRHTRQFHFRFVFPADSPVDVKGDRTMKSSWSGTSGSGIRDTVAHVFSMLPIHLYSLSLKWPGKGYVKKTRNKKARGLWAAKAVRYIFWKESSEIYILAHFKFMHASDGTSRTKPKHLCKFYSTRSVASTVFPFNNLWNSSLILPSSLWSSSFVLPSSSSFELTGSRDNPFVRSGISAELPDKLVMECIVWPFCMVHEGKRNVPGSFLSTKNTTKLTVYLWK